MSLDEQAAGHADAIVLHSAAIQAELLRARSGQLSIAEYGECKRRMVAALGNIKAEVLRAMNAGIYARLESELKRRGFGGVQ